MRVDYFKTSKKLGLSTCFQMIIGKMLEIIKLALPAIMVVAKSGF
jgi:hypothetical protein